MDVSVKQVLVDFITILFEEGSSDVIQGVKRKDASNFENSHNCIGGSGSYRVNISSKYILHFKELNSEVKSIDITSFLKKAFNVQKIMPKRKHVIKNTKPETKQLIFDKILDGESVRYQIKEDDKKTIDWVKQMKDLL